MFREKPGFLSLRPDRKVPMEKTPCDILFPSAFLENPFAVPQDGEVRPPGSASKKNNFKTPGRAKTHVEVMEEKMLPVPEPFLGLLRLEANSGVVGGQGAGRGF